MHESEIEILLSSDCDYEEITAEIFINGKYVALLNKDQGVDNLKIEFPDSNVDEIKVLRKIDLATLEKAIALARDRIKS